MARRRKGQLRIIGGELRSRLIDAPPDAEKTRPLPDRVRESLFNLLRGHVEGELVVDVFAGTGSFGIEALSRGAHEAWFVERDRAIAKLLHHNIDALDLGERAHLVQADALGVTTPLRVPERVHIVFFDPPYPLMRDPGERDRVFEQVERFAERLDPEGYAILRTPWPYLDTPDPEDNAPDTSPEPITLERTGLVGPETHPYGSTALHFYMRSPEDKA